MDPATLFLLFFVYLAYRFYDDARNLAARSLAPAAQRLGDRATSRGASKLGSALRRAAGWMAARPRPGTPRTATGTRLRDSLRAALQAATGGRRKRWTDQRGPAWGNSGAGGAGTAGGPSTGGGAGGAGTGAGPSTGGADAPDAGPSNDSPPSGGADPADTTDPETVPASATRRDRTPTAPLDPFRIPAVGTPPPALPAGPVVAPPPWWLPRLAAQALNAARVAWVDALAGARTALARAHTAATGPATDHAGNDTGRPWKWIGLTYQATRQGWPQNGEPEHPATVYIAYERADRPTAPALEASQRGGATHCTFTVLGDLTGMPRECGDTDIEPGKEYCRRHQAMFDHKRCRWRLGEMPPCPNPIDPDIHNVQQFCTQHLAETRTLPADLPARKPSLTEPDTTPAAPAAPTTAPTERNTMADTPQAAESGLTGFITHSSDMVDKCRAAADTAMEAALQDVRDAIASTEKTMGSMVADQYAGTPVSAYQNALAKLATIAEGMEAAKQLFGGCVSDYQNAHEVFCKIRDTLAANHAALEAEGTTAESVPSIRS